jgi:hypothetical protein
MVIVAKILWRLRAGLDLRLRVEGGLFARAAGARELCVAIASIYRAGMGRIPGRRE